MLAAMRQIGPKKEELQHAEERRNDPKQDQIFGGDKQFQQVESDGCSQYLPDGNVFFGKRKKPDPEVFIAFVKVRIGICARMAVVLVMFGKQLAVAVIHKQKGTKAAHEVVYFGVGRKNGAMHGIMGCDKKAGIQMGLEQNQ